MNTAVSPNPADARPSQLGVWLVIAGMACAVLLAGWLALWISDNRRAAITRAQAQASNIARALAAAVADDIARTDRALQTLVAAHARAPERGFAPDGALAAALGELGASLPQADALIVSDAQGTVRLRHGGSAAAPQALGERDFFIAAREGTTAAPVLSEPWQPHAGAPWVVSLARALRSADGRFAGVVHADLRGERWAGRFAEVDLGQEGVVSLRSGTLALVARATAQGIATDALGSRDVSPQVRAALAANPLAGTYEGRAVSDGVERAGAYQRVDGHPLVVLVGSGTDEYPSRLVWPRSASGTAPP